MTLTAEAIIPAEPTVWEAGARTSVRAFQDAYLLELGPGPDGGALEDDGEALDVWAALAVIERLCPGWRPARGKAAPWYARRRGNFWEPRDGLRHFYVAAPTPLDLFMRIAYQSLLDIAEEFPHWLAGPSARERWWAVLDPDDSGPDGDASEDDAVLPRTVWAPCLSALVHRLRTT